MYSYKKNFNGDIKPAFTIKIERAVSCQVCYLKINFIKKHQRATGMGIYSGRNQVQKHLTGVGHVYNRS